MPLADRCVFQTAVLLMQEHTDQAEAYATSRADKAQQEGDTKRAMAWHLVACVIEELQRRREPGETLN
jgi:hypothetical protein